MEKIEKMICDYVPVNEQEAIDKKQMLEYIATYDNLLTRDNPVAHFSSSGFIVNKTHDKVLFVHHNIYNSWGWTGGHMDGDKDFIAVAMKEAIEETGVNNVRLLHNDIGALDILSVIGHYKNDKYVSAHVHLSLAYILEVDETEKLISKPDENSGVQWFAIKDIQNVVSERCMLAVYEKLIRKM